MTTRPPLPSTPAVGGTAPGTSPVLAAAQDASGDHLGCADHRLSRRNFLRGALAATGTAVVTSVLGDTVRSVAYGAPAPGGNVVVVLSLRGGVDGLSLVVPHGDPGYAAARPRIAVPTSQLVGRDDQFGLHPSFAPLLGMWQAGRFGAVQAVGLPQPNRSHFAAMEEIEDADPTSSVRQGWVNRLVAMAGDGQPVQATQLGGPVLTTALHGGEPALAASRLSELALPGPDDPDLLHDRRVALHRMYRAEPGPLGHGARSALVTTRSLGGVATAPVVPANGATYPEGTFGTTLAEVAALVRADVGARVVAVDHGTWDMHTRLGNLDWGLLGPQVDELAQGLLALFTDLGGLGERVTVVTVSEFGRRLAENGAFGTDHGWGNCMLLLGGGVRGGAVHGTWPGLGDGDLVDGDLAVTTDARSVLAEVVADRFPDVDLSRVFPGFRPESIGSMGAP